MIIIQDEWSSPINISDCNIIDSHKNNDNGNRNDDNDDDDDDDNNDKHSNSKNNSQGQMRNCKKHCLT